MDKNLNDVIDRALKLEPSEENQIVTVECPCCHREFYAIKSEVYYENIYRNTDGYAADPQKFSFITFPKCPHCGFSGMFTPGNLFKGEQK